MADLIATNNKPKMQAKKGLVSFKDCPNKCVDGYIFQPYGHRRVLCPYCEEKRKSIINEDAVIVNEDGDKVSIADELNLQKSWIGTAYDFNAVLPEFAVKSLVADSVESIKDTLQGLINNSNIGELQDESILLNLGSKVCWRNFVYPYMMNYYREGRSVAPLLTPLDICKYRAYAEQYGIQDSSHGINYYDIIDRDVCVIALDSGVTKTGVDAVKGLMQLRANKDKSTLIITDYWGNFLDSVYHTEPVKLLNIAKLYSVTYTQKFTEQEKKREAQFGTSAVIPQSNQVSSKDFQAMLRPNNGSHL